MKSTISIEDQMALLGGLWATETKYKRATIKRSVVNLHSGVYEIPRDAAEIQGYINIASWQGSEKIGRDYHGSR
jgi:hypothetical protein